MNRVRRAARSHLRPTPPAASPLAETTVAGGPLRGRRLLVPAPGSDYFRRVAAGDEDRELWVEAAALDGTAEVVFDVGGYVGLHALSWAALFPSARVVTFEPAPINRRWLERNLALNPDLAERIEVRAACAADFVGTTELRTSENIGSGHSSSSTMVATANARISPPDLIADLLTVPVTTLDAVAAEVGFPQVVKIDVENAEPAVLRGAGAVLARAPLFLLEVHTPRSMLECLPLLRSGPRVLKEEPDGRVFLAARP